MTHANNPKNAPCGTSRRRVLKTLGLGAGALALGGTGGFIAYKRSLRLPAADAGRLRSTRFVVAGGSIGGLTDAASLLRRLPDAKVTVIEPRAIHHYQPGYTLVGAGVYDKSDVLYQQEDMMIPGWV